MSKQFWSRLLAIVAVLAVCCSAFVAQYTQAQPAAQGTPLKPVAGQSVAHAVTIPLRDMKPDPPTRGVQEDERENGILPKIKPDGSVQPQLDPAVQRNLLGRDMPNPLTSFDGVGNVNGVLPPDTNGDIGYDPATGKRYYMQWVNLSYAVWDVTNAASITQVIPPRNGNTLFSALPAGQCKTNNDGDPIVLFDHLANRWMASQFAVDGPYFQCIAVSQTADPTGAWNVYAFQISTTKFNDYPHFGVWPDGYYMAINQFNPDDSYGGAGAVVFNRDDMINGVANARFQYIDLASANLTFGGMLPTDLDGTGPPPGAPNLFAEVDDDQGTPSLGADALRVWRFHVDWNTPANTTFGLAGQPNHVLPVAAFNLMPCVLTGSRSCIPQPSTSAGLDSLGDRLMHRMQYRNFGDHQALVVNHTVNAGSGVAGVRWYEVRDPFAASSANPTIYQQGTYSPDSTHRWMASAALDIQGNMGLGFSVSSSSIFPSIRYTGRLAGDPLGTLPQGEATLVNGGGSQTSSFNRWGDYSMLGVDPQDQCTFWYTDEYMQTTSSAGWSTRIGSFKFPGCTAGPSGTLVGKVKHPTGTPIAGAAVVANNTISTLSDINGDYRLPLPVGTYTVTASISGYSSQTFTGLTITENVTRTQDFTLTGGAVAGVVRDSFTPSQPIAGATVSDGTTTITTGANGAYLIPRTQVGSHTITVSKQGYSPQSATVNVADDQTTTQNFTLPGSAITGLVSDATNSSPVAGATVTVSGNPTVTTDATGRYATRVPPGTYNLSINKVGYVPANFPNVALTNGITTTRNVQLAPIFGYAPAQLSRTLTYGQIITVTKGLTLTNNSANPITATIQEQAGRFTPFAPTANKFLVVNRSAATAATAAKAALTSLGYTYDEQTNTVFESTAVATLLTYDAVIYVGNTGTSATSASNTKLIDYLNAGGRLFIADNDLGFFNTGFPFYDTYLDATYVGDDPGAANRNLTGEDIMLGVNPPSSDLFPDYFTTKTSSTRIFRYVNGTTGGSRISRNNYKAIYLATDFDRLGTTATGEPIEATVLQRSLAFLTGGGAFVDNIPWLTETPTTQRIPANSTVNTQIVFDSTKVAQPGTYTGTLLLNNTAVPTQTAQIPVTMIVNPNANQHRLSGTATTTGVCDANPAPLNGATITIQGSGGFTTTLTTGTNGAYSYFVTNGTYQVTVRAPDHLTTTATVVVNNADATQNFTLRLQKPCILTSPNALTASVQLGQQTTRTMVITSSGALTLTYALAENPSNGYPLPDASGYTWSTLPAQFIDASDGTATNPTDDGEFNVTLPFNFPFYGITTSQLRVGNNGAVLVGPTTGEVDYANLAMTGAPNYFLAPFWDDFSSQTGSIYTKVVGTAPQRQFVIQWLNRPHYNGVGAATFEIVLFESGSILYQYQDVDFGNPSFNNGASATVGIRGGDAANSSQFSFNTPSLSNNFAVCFSRPGALSCNDVPWLSETPVAGTLRGTPPSTQSVTVGFNAAAVNTPGVYTATLIIGHNAPQPPVLIPVRMNVTNPPNYGTVNGTIIGLGVCDTPGGPLNGAQLRISTSPTTTLTTGNDGQYLYGLPAGPYSLVASAPGYVTQMVTLAVTPQITTTTNFALRRFAPCQGTSQTAMSSTQLTNQVVSQTLVISNSGAAALTWNIQERANSAPASGDAASTTRRPVTSKHPQQPIVFMPQADVIQDGSFEATNPSTFTNPFWAQSSTNYGTVICSQSGCGGPAPHTGTFHAWFGGIAATDPTEIGSLSQPVQLSGGTTTLSFWLRIGTQAARASDFLKVSLDNVELFTVDGASTAYNVPTQVTLPITQTGGMHTLRFDSTVNTGGNTNFFVDDVVLDTNAPACSANALPWVSVNPNSGTVVADSTSNVSVTFDSTGLPTGTYTGTLCLTSNDVRSPSVDIPVSLTVADPATATPTATTTSTAMPTSPPTATSTAIATTATSVLTTSTAAATTTATTTATGTPTTGSSRVYLPLVVR